MQIVTDSGTDVYLSPQERDELKIHVVPLVVTLDGKSYQEGVNITPAEFYPLLEASGKLPTTSQPSAGVFAELYRKLAASDPDILSIHLTAGVFGVVLCSWAQAQEAPSQQQAQAECQSIAQQQTGYNPNAAATSQPQAGGRARGAAAGAMAGAAKGKSKSNQYSRVPDNVAEEYTRNQMQDAAKMGVVAGASRQRQGRRQDAAAQNSSANAYNQVYSACMAAKGFPAGM